MDRSREVEPGKKVDNNKPKETMSEGQARLREERDRFEKHE